MEEKIKESLEISEKINLVLASGKDLIIKANGFQYERKDGKWLPQKKLRP